MLNSNLVLNKSRMIVRSETTGRFKPTKFILAITFSIKRESIIPYYDWDDKRPYIIVCHKTSNLFTFDGQYQVNSKSQTLLKLL